MIIVKLIGGLGNQMFQYACGRAVSLKLGTDLKLDISNFDKEGSPRREYALGVFKISESFASEEEINFLKPRVNFLTQKSPRLYNFLGKRTRYYVDEFLTGGKIPDNQKNLYLSGFWQSEDYFEEVEKTIREDFTFKSPLLKENVKWFELINNTLSVSLHIRRTDYIFRPKGRREIVGCSLGYYQRAIEYIINQSKVRPSFFVFSDDLPWGKENIHYSGYNFYHLSTSDDLKLMSECKHNITANSSFSWWGAWLNQNPGKIVIAPYPWFENPPDRIYEIIPPGWIKIPKV